RRLQRGDDVATPQLGLRARVQLHEVDGVRLQALETAGDGVQERGRSPVAGAEALRMPALREEKALATTRPEGAADQRFAVGVALGRVDHVEAGVQRAVQQASDGGRGRGLVADLAAAE